MRKVRVLLPLALVASVAPAAAIFTTIPNPPSMSVATATLQPASGLSAGNGACVPLLSRQVNLSWTATPSTFADGYQVFRSTSNGGPYSSIATVAGRTTTTYVDAAVAASTTYYYVVQATKINWRSVNSNQASVTTPSAACL